MEKIKLNVNENREIERQLHNLQNIDDKYIFYYDETNNIRKFWFKDENKLNISTNDLTKNFVLGGLLHKKIDTEFGIENLKKSLKLQKTIKEVKLDHLAKGNFISCLDSKKLEIFLDWLISNNLYIHYSSLNILYFALVDIIDSIIPDEYIKISFDLKTVLYEIAKIDLDNFLEILYKYDYPNIKRNLARIFLDELTNYIKLQKQNFVQKYPNINQNIIDLIINLINNSDDNDLTFIMNEKEHILIDGLFEFYLRPLGIFKNSQHIFDEEDKIEKIFESYQLYDGDKKLDNFKFHDSENYDLIQFSDVFIGLIGKLFDYINKLEFKEINKIKNDLNTKQIKNFSSIIKLLLKSDKQSLGFNHSIQSLLDREKLILVTNEFI